MFHGNKRFVTFCNRNKVQWFGLISFCHLYTDEHKAHFVCNIRFNEFKHFKRVRITPRLRSFYFINVHSLFLLLSLSIRFSFLLTTFTWLDSQMIREKFTNNWLWLNSIFHLYFHIDFIISPESNPCGDFVYWSLIFIDVCVYVY